MQLDFEEWLDIFIDECHKMGYDGPIDKYSFESDWEIGKTPEESAKPFVDEMLDE